MRHVCIICGNVVPSRVRCGSWEPIKNHKASLAAWDGVLSPFTVRRAQDGARNGSILKALSSARFLELVSRPCIVVLDNEEIIPSNHFKSAFKLLYVYLWVGKQAVFIRLMEVKASIKLCEHKFYGFWAVHLILDLFGDEICHIKYMIRLSIFWLNFT